MRPFSKIFWLSSILFLQASLTLPILAKDSKKVQKSIVLATTTSTQDTGLLDVLLPKFKENSGIEVKVVAVGSGQAMELGKRGDADILIVHSPAAENEFMKEGYGETRRPLMHNDFVIVGPASDLAHIKGTALAADAFKKISENKNAAIRFISRGDNSGTHVKEKSIWEKAGITPASGDWYLSSGSGMGEVLMMADEKSAYTLCDRSSFLALQKKKDIRLVILVEGDKALLNNYSIIELSKAKFPKLKHAEAKKFADFLFSTEGKKLISEFGVKEFGQPLFFLEK